MALHLLCLQNTSESVGHEIVFEWGPRVWRRLRNIRYENELYPREYLNVLRRDDPEPFAGTLAGLGPPSGDTIFRNYNNAGISFWIISKRFCANALSLRISVGRLHVRPRPIRVDKVFDPANDEDQANLALIL